MIFRDTELKAIKNTREEDKRKTNNFMPVILSTQNAKKKLFNFDHVTTPKSSHKNISARGLE